ncbi:MAG: DinB family protein [Candidatus Eisenbacteria bacterium]
MAQKLERRFLPSPKGYRSAEAASFIAQLDDLTRRMFEDLKGATSAELGWSPKRGHNTMGMLLAHLAIVEGFWVHFAKHGEYDMPALERILGIGSDDDGIPMPANGKPPATLRGRTLASYRALLKRSRAYVSRTCRAFTDAHMDKRYLRVRHDGSRAEMDVRWILYHVVEHFSGHYGQILLMRHQYRDRRRKA